MTGDGMCGVFIPDRVLAGWWRSQWKASDQMWAGRCTTGCGRGQVYKCECDHCSVLGGCLLFLSLCSSGFQDLLRSLAFHWLLHLPARTLPGINTPHIPSPVVLHPPAYEDGTDRGFRNIGY